jgi:subtilisin family serine protease
MNIKSGMASLLGLGTTLLLTISLAATASSAPLRIAELQPCALRLDESVQEFCLLVRGLKDGSPIGVHLAGDELAEDLVQRDGDLLRLRLDRNDFRSRPLWLEQDGEKSNAVWLTLQGAQIVAATEATTVRNRHEQNTYLDLVSLVMREDVDALSEAKRLAAAYDAEIVGAIAPLGVFQLRLPVDSLGARDAMVLRLSGEVNVVGVVIEETSPEEPLGDEEQVRSLPPDSREWAANRFLEAIELYRQRNPQPGAGPAFHPVRIGVIERNVDFDTPDFSAYLGDCRRDWPRVCVYARDAEGPDGHGTAVAGVLAAVWGQGGNSGFLRGLDGAGPGFEVIVDRNSNGGLSANVAASVNLIRDGARVINWSWGIHRVGAIDIEGDEIGSLTRSGEAMHGYQVLLDRFFSWLQREHPDVIIVNSAGNASFFAGRSDYRLPSSLYHDQLLVVGGHEIGDQEVSRADPDHVIRRGASSLGMRVDVSAAACMRGTSLEPGERGDRRCGTSFSTPLVSGLLAAVLSIDPDLEPAAMRALLRGTALTIGDPVHFGSVDRYHLTAPILPSERPGEPAHTDIGRSARLDMYGALRRVLGPDESN